MATAEVLWAPHPYRAGFCITDDTDAATPESVTIVYDFLASIGLRTTKTVWAFTPSEPCGIPALPPSITRGVTLEHAGYLDCVRRLSERGFEIALHGASAGNNVRARTEAALALLERHCRPSRTYVCHAKNAENPYWHERVAPHGPAQWLLGIASRYRCSGEDPSSPYFWGDLCLERGLRIRLFRTRNVNTLAANPSMPYHDPEKPYVAAWFSATKRSFADCCAPESIAQLRSENGLCVLYQYMHRYADLERGRVAAGFQTAAERLMAAGDVWVDTTERLMDRLQAMQGVFVAARGEELWLANANPEDVTEVQVMLEGARVTATPPDTAVEGSRVRIRRLPAGRAVCLGLDRSVAGEASRLVPLDARGRGVRRVADGAVHVNVGSAPWHVDDRLTLEPGSCVARLESRPGNRPLARASAAERYALLGGQLATIAREVLWKGRSLDSRKFLGAETITLEDHANW
jgi:hypothetical protein